MSRYKDEQCRICRREGQKLFLKGERFYSDKCSISRRNYAPGQNGQKKSKLSEYGTQLREKQKTKSFYGVGEKQFRKYFEMASNTKGKTGEVLLQLLESRLDNVVYRLGFASSRTQARMLLQESGREPKCAICGFSEHVEACHIKPISSFPLDTKIREVNDLGNLIYLCPNHHILLDRGKLSKEDISHISELSS